MTAGTVAADSTRTSRGEGPSRLLVGITWRRRLLASLLRNFDIASTAIAFGLTIVFVAQPLSSLSLSEFASIRFKLENFAIFLGLILIWRFGFKVCAVHDANRPLLSARRIPEILKAVCLNVICLGGAATVASVEIVSAPFLIVFGLLSAILILLTRVAFRALLLLVDANSDARSLVVLGTGSRARAFERACDEDRESGSRVLGFVDDNWPGMDEFRADGGHVVSDVKNLGAFFDANVVDELVVALPLEALAPIRANLLSVCHEHGVNVRILASTLTDQPALARSRLTADDIVITVFNGRVDGWSLMGKRLLDIVGSLALLAAFSPAFLLVSALIKLDSRGPVFFSHQRVGLNNRRFQMLKFRTMVDGSDGRIDEFEKFNEVDGPVFKFSADPRITRVGRYLRVWSIDELPQLWNVLKGEMSLVGPRPLPLRDVAKFEACHHRRRFSVRPGITGLWQINGRSSLRFVKWMEYDLQYVDEWSLSLDILILLKTLPAVLSRRGAA